MWELYSSLFCKTSMSDEKGKMIIHSTGIALMEILDESCILKYSPSDEELFQDVNSGQWFVSGCSEVCIWSTRHLHDVEWIELRLAVCNGLSLLAFLDSWFPSQWPTGSHQQPVNLWIQPKQKGGVSPQTPLSLVTPTCPGRVLSGSASPSLHNSLFTIIVHKDLVDHQPFSLLSMLRKIKSFWNANLKRGEIQFQLPKFSFPVLVHHSRSKSNVTSSDSSSSSPR